MESTESTNTPTIIHKFIQNYPVLEYQNTNIYIIENVLNDELCHKFIDLIDVIPKTKFEWKPGNNVRCHLCYLSELLKKKDDLFYPVYTDETEIIDKINKNENILTNRLNGIQKEKINKLEQDLNECLKPLDAILKELTKTDIFSFKNHCGFILRKIHGETKEHQDGESPVIEDHPSLYFIKEQNLHSYRENKDTNKKNKVNIRILTAVFALNDDYDGGEFCFPEYNIKTKLKKGSVIFFPPYWTHKHRVESPLNETFRYTLNTWIYKDEYFHS